MRKLVVMRTGEFVPRSDAAIAGRTFVAAAAGLTMMLASCSSMPREPAPIVESSAQTSPPIVQSTAQGSMSSVTPAPVVPTTTALALAEPGFYRVKPGDTLFAISRQYKQKPDDLAHWNNLPESRQVNVGQLLRVVPPGASASTASNASSAPPGSKASQPPLLPTPGKFAAEPAASKPAVVANEEKAPSATAARSTFAWPARGEVVRKFGASGNKGIDIAGKVGEPVKAAAAGKVVYAGSGLRSYGRMIIVRHSNNYLTAYAYNEKLFVKEGDSVKQGTMIADMGTAPGGSVALHFEVRKAGAAVDPVPLLGAGG